MAWHATNVFILGVNFPVQLLGHAIVASKGNTVLYTIGNNYPYVSNADDIYKFECTDSITNCSWTKIPTKLQHARRFLVAFPIPEGLANKICN